MGERLKRKAVQLLLVPVLIGLFLAAGCGRKGPPVAPHDPERPAAENPLYPGEECPACPQPQPAPE